MIVEQATSAEVEAPREYVDFDDDCDDDFDFK